MSERVSDEQAAHEAPYRVEVESERAVTLKTYCVMGPDGYADGQMFEDYGDDDENAQDLADTLNKGWLAGRASAEAALSTAQARIAELESALRGLFGFVADDFPEDDVYHPLACVTDIYRDAARAAHKALSAAPTSGKVDLRDAVVEAACGARESAKHYAPDQESTGFQNYIKALADLWNAVDAYLSPPAAPTEDK